MAPRKNSHTNQCEIFTKEIQHIKLDNNVMFSSIGGLEEHIKCLREMVLFPLIYQDFFKRFNTRPPKGVLFHGPPGTGKTLLARALANECGVVRGKKVAFFMRKGADIMSKWFGESEKQIKMLFQQATKMRPSIIFFDELDALAPVRSECQGEVYASVVATLLVEMDGLWDRGDVIVIGATNRPDCVDPALRRPGRLDRELYFPPPSLMARRDILEINTRRWLPRPKEEMLEQMAQLTHGFLGSDLNGLCSEAVLKALRRVYPQVYEGDYHCLSSIDTRKVEVTIEDMLEAKRALVPAGNRYCPFLARRLLPYLEPLIGPQVKAAAEMMRRIFPAAVPSQEDVFSTPCVFLICGDCAEVHIAPALLTQLEHCAVKELSMATLHSVQKYSQESAILSIFSDCRRTERNPVIFIPDVADVWEAMSNTPGQSLLLQQWRNRAAGENALLLATCQGHHGDLPEALQELFPNYKNCVYRIRNPLQSEVINLFTPILEKVPTMTLSAVHEQSGQSVKSNVLSDLSHEVKTSSNLVEPSPPSPAATESLLQRKRRHPDQQRGHDHKRTKITKDSFLSISDDETRLKKDFYPDFSKILKSNVECLCRLGLATLTDLHAQLNNTINGCCSARDRMQLPNELYAITVRYLKLARKC